MATIKPFRAFRPGNNLAEKVASKPYDVLSSAEAKIEAQGNSHSFLHVIKPEIDLPDETDLYSEAVYEKARSNFLDMINAEILVQDNLPHLYIYRQIMDGREQYGLVACSSIDDYFNDIIKKHEFTRPEKENDRIRHMKTIGAHPGPVFLTYHAVNEIDKIVNEVAGSQAPVVDFTADDGVQHSVWVVSDPSKNETLVSLFSQKVAATYIADGHHRAASSAKVGAALRQENVGSDGSEDFNFFLSVLFPANQLHIMDYNRVVKDLNGLSEAEFLEKVKNNFSIEEMAALYKPTQLHEFSMYLNGKWYRLQANQNTYDPNDPIKVLDVSVLSDYLFDPVLGIKDQRTDKRIGFIGGIRGLEELEKRVDSGEMKVAIALYPVSIQQLIDISDSGNVMPPKSTWFEPKLRSGLFVHLFER